MQIFQTVKAEKVDEKNGVMCLFSMFPSWVMVLKFTHREKALPNKTPALAKSMNMGIWIVGTSNQLFIRSS